MLNFDEIVLQAREDYLFEILKGFDYMDSDDPTIKTFVAFMNSQCFETFDMIQCGVDLILYEILSMIAACERIDFDFKIR